MAITLGSNHGALNGVTPVTMAAAPSSGVRVVKQLAILNRDSVDITLLLFKTVSGTDYYFEKRVNLASGESWRPIDGDDVFFLTASTQSLRVSMSGAVTTTAPGFTCSYFDRD